MLEEAVQFLTAANRSFELIVVALGSAVTVKLLEFLYKGLRQKSERSRTAKALVDRHLDPLLKSADEIVGKLTSMAKSDFRSLGREPVDYEKKDPIVAPDFWSLVFLFAAFWSRWEILRKESLSVSLNSDERGKKLQAFLSCLESRKVRLVDRISQRAIGEVMIVRHDTGLDAKRYVDLFDQAGIRADVLRWLRPLLSIVNSVHDKRIRQRVLCYGVVLHALIDTLDSEKLVTRRRPSYANKLSRKSYRDLKYRVFNMYLKGLVTEAGKYVDSPK